MDIKRAEYVKGAVEMHQYPEDKIPHVVLVGKSNVGKSSFINCITNNFKLARISDRPGKTRLINFYKLNDAFFVVDVPGYGYARVSKEEQQKWAEMMDEFLSTHKSISLIIHIIDIRHAPSSQDIQMSEWIAHSDIPFIIMATKADKIARSQWKTQSDLIRTHLNLPENILVIPFSSVTRVGRKEALDCIGGYI